MGNTMRTISLKLPDELDRRLARLAKRRQMTRSEIIRAALDAFDPETAESFTAAASDLVGAIDGPRDLASSPRHMTGYGK
jgi:predicted DNA-binding protein